MTTESSSSSQPAPPMIYDTTVLIGFFRGQPAARNYIHRAIDGEVRAFVTAITEAEIWTGIKDADEETRFLALLRFFQRIKIDSDIARQAGYFRRRYRHDGLSLPDALQADSANLA